ncbi:hypothetical protein BABINDRAFT_8963 [Babjeviella inositovora NRRL Y-12698]|uniref:t-SNARE coiled-coil homology domain-containing protein n=1 Tax=Babjeviella inositovora NRRL Y-12698 TaxID=984486 RepID=A0A1E3QM40_9ASCO|nr:uncharacterized protein BABINDRAFT_8963 [Babjeviella inositovora NRRL Y-12698]ODQ78720.1 hypothetical protein BABINDRAFT_8963 [Babjeviella inositovora NRRL Y-12698]
MFRDRTNLYISYRRTFPHHSKTKSSQVDRFRSINREEEGLGLMNYRDDGNDMILDEFQSPLLPPAFHDVGMEIDDSLKAIDQQIAKLNSLYKKNLLPGFNDRSLDEEEIEKLNYMITRKFQICYKLIKKFDSLKEHLTVQNELVMLENMKKNYAIKVQLTTSTFRKLQNNYIKFLKDDEFEEQPLNKNSDAMLQEEDDELSSKTIENYSRQALNQSQSMMQQQQGVSQSLIQQREREISSIAQGVLEVSTIFREMQNMVIDQGTILDRIDYNMANVVHELKGADRELDKATTYQKSTQKCKIILLLVLLCFMLLMIVIVKPKHTTTIVEGDKSKPHATATPTPTEGTKELNRIGVDPVGQLI